MPRSQAAQEYQEGTDRLADEFAREARRDILKPDRGLSVFHAIAPKPWRAAPIGRERLKVLLARSEQHVLDGEIHLASQCRVIETLQAVGADTKLAREVLKTFQHLQETHIEDRDRIAADLAEALKR